MLKIEWLESQFEQPALWQKLSAALDAMDRSGFSTQSTNMALPGRGCFLFYPFPGKSNVVRDITLGSGKPPACPAFGPEEIALEDEIVRVLSTVDQSGLELSGLILIASELEGPERSLVGVAVHVGDKNGAAELLQLGRTNPSMAMEILSAPGINEKS